MHLKEGCRWSRVNKKELRGTGHIPSTEMFLSKCLLEECCVPGVGARFLADAKMAKTERIL